jgi:hypothetical protein
MGWSSTLKIVRRQIDNVAGALPKEVRNLIEFHLTLIGK